MLDKYLAELFSVKAMRLREQVKRNPDKFPEHFMFQLTEIEVEIMVSHFAIPSKKQDQPPRKRIGYKPNH